jgi:hypothetical protein
VTPDLSAYERKCGSCDAPIIWARTLTGRSMPVDAKPSDGGTVLLELRQGSVRAHVVSGGELNPPEPVDTEPVSLRTSHSTTCPDADKRRKPRRA